MHHLSLEERFAQAQSALSGQDAAAYLDRPLSIWVISTDRHLPQAFLSRSLRDFLAFSFDELAETHGMGNRRIEKLIDVLERVGKQPLHHIRRPLEPQDHTGMNGAPVALAESISPDDLTEPVWRAWCQAIRSHRLEHENLGRFAGSLSELPQGLWAVPLSEYAYRPLYEIRSMPGHGPARTAQVFDVFSRIALTIVGCPSDSPLAIRLLPPLARDVVLWAEAVLRDTAVPDSRAISEGFLTPLFSLLETDLGAETAMTVRRRIGLDGQAETLEQIARTTGITKERVRQIILRAAQVIRIRWPEGRYILDNVYGHFLGSTGCEEQVALLHSVLDVCFAMDMSRGGTRTEILEAWNRAGRTKRTPMSEAGVRLWAAEEFPDLPADVIRRCLEEEGLSDCPISGVMPLCDIETRHPCLWERAG